MRTKEHWEVCKELVSYHSAQHMACHLRELLRARGVDPHGVKVLSKEEIRGGVADAQLMWNGGPCNWTQGIELMNIPGVCAEVENENTISFYDTY